MTQLRVKNVRLRFEKQREAAEESYSLSQKKKNLEQCVKQGKNILKLSPATRKSTEHLKKKTCEKTIK